MDLKQIKELMAAMEKAGIKKIRIKEEKGFEVELEREGEQPELTTTPTLLMSKMELGHHHPHAPIHRVAQEEDKQHLEEKTGRYVHSPMVGTFYSATSPDDPPFIKIGDRVEEDTIVCIIEAMKVMNEVKAGAKGQIAEIMVDNAHPVEFGTKMFRIVPSSAEK